MSLILSLLLTYLLVLNFQGSLIVDSFCVWVMVLVHTSFHHLFKYLFSNTRSKTLLVGSYLIAFVNTHFFYHYVIFYHACVPWELNANILVEFVVSPHTILSFTSILIANDIFTLGEYPDTFPPFFFVFLQVALQLWVWTKTSSIFCTWMLKCYELTFRWTKLLLR